MTTYRVAVRLCDEAGCSRPHYGLGWCYRHYMKDRNRRLGVHSGPLAGDDWYRSRIEAGHEWSLVPQTHSRLPKIEHEPWEPLSACNGLTDLLAVDPEDSALAADLPNRIRAALRVLLPERERRIVELRFGFEGEPWTLADIGHELDITRERVRQLEGQALQTLKGAVKNRNTFSAPQTPRSAAQEWPAFPVEEVGPPVQMLHASPPIPCPCCGARLDYPDHHNCVREWLEAQT